MEKDGSHPFKITFIRILEVRILEEDAYETLLTNCTSKIIRIIKVRVTESVLLYTINFTIYLKTHQIN